MLKVIVILLRESQVHGEKYEVYSKVIDNLPDKHPSVLRLQIVNSFSDCIKADFTNRCLQMYLLRD